MRKIKNINHLFLISLVSVFFVHLIFVFIEPFADDEYFYLTIPFRIINGDSLVQDEWHLTQFSSLFSCLPVYIWTSIKGSADGIFIFIRLLYLLIHTTIAVVIYKFFKKQKIWAVVASMMFYIQIPYRILGLSYHSVFVMFLLLLSLCLFSIYEKNSTRLYILSGFCFGCCCVCNPIFCFAFLLYLIACVLWAKRQKLKELFSAAFKKEKKLTKKQKKQQEAQNKQKEAEKYAESERFGCFFTKEAVRKFFSGIMIIAVIAVGFYFATGATLSTLTDNLEHLLSSSEYDVASSSVFSKLGDTLSYFTKANLGMPFILPILFVALLADGKRKQNSNRVKYLTASLVWSVIFLIGLFVNMEFYLWALSLPFFVFSTVCYLLTEKKNKALFRCMYLPCIIGAFFHYLAADMHLATIGIVLAVANVSGVFFVMDLWREMRNSIENETTGDENKSNGWHRGLIITGVCFQLLFYLAFYTIGQLPVTDAVKADKGVYAGLYMSENKLEIYNKKLDDLEYIRSVSDENDPVLIATYSSWMYLQLDRPIATYTTWYRGSLDVERLIEYYKENPDKIPEYIYVEAYDTQSNETRNMINAIGRMFTFTEEDLSRGVLLTVENCRF